MTGVDLNSKEEGALTKRKADDKQPFSALAFRIMTDPFVGQLTFFRVYSGTLATRLGAQRDQRQDRANWPPAENAREQA